MTANAEPAAWRPEGKPRVVVIGPDRPEVRELWDVHRELLSRHAEFVAADFGFRGCPESQDADFGLVLGGDGSILASARCFGDRQLPVLGVNLGRLGFLAAITPQQLPAVWEEVCRGGCLIRDHLMLRVEVTVDGRVVRSELALNEAAVLNGPPFSMLHLDLYVDQELATTYSCDGLILATPVGSTAHNLSAGGPILRKDLQAVVISPLSPHTLTVRPVIDSADRCYEVVLRAPTDLANVVADGRLLAELTPERRIRVRRATPRFRMIEPTATNYYQTLRDKLGWGGALPARIRR